MKFKSLILKNFRNFEDVNVKLDNKNVIFGLNDIGKSNMLAALRFLLDSSFRKNSFIESDFYNSDTSKEIEITLKIDINNFEDFENKKIRTMMKGAIPSGYNEVYIQIKSVYNPKSLSGDIFLYWGVDYKHLEEVPSTQSRYALDYYFNVVYIDSSIRLDTIFKKYAKEILREESSLSEEERIKLNDNIKQFNKSVSELKSIKEFEGELIKEYQKFRDEKHFNVSIQSEVEISNIHSKLTPYIQDESKKNYPTSGDGRRKLLAYTLLTLENRRQEERKINIFLVEELENHLHRSMQIALSYQLFSDQIFKYLFLTTHSSLIVSQMDNVNLIKLFKKCQVVGKSHIYQVPPEYKQMKQKLNQNLAEAIYADVVLLIEGPSERTLFDSILREKCPKFEALGGYILEVNGVSFKDYQKVLTELGVKVIVRTDNDIQKIKGKDEYYMSGMNRGFVLANKDRRIKITDINHEKYAKNANYVVSLKKECFDKVPVIIDYLKKKNIFLSRVDLENDLYEAISSEMDALADENGSSKNGVDFLQSAKLYNMVSLCKNMKPESINKIYEHDRFECIRELVKQCHL
ncbi:recombination protein F [compost metagenome]